MAGPLKNQRHELFAQGIAAGKPGSQAYREAGYTATGNGAETNAARLIRTAQVAARIKELRTRAAGRTEVTIERLIIQATTIHDEAMKGKRKQLANALKANEQMAKLAGLWIEKSERVTKHADPDKLTDAQLAAALAEIRGAVPGVGGQAEEDTPVVH